MNLLTLEEEKTKTVTIKGREFEIRFISMKDELLIKRKIRALTGNARIEEMTEGEYSLADNIATVDFCTEKFPKEIDSTKSAIEWGEGDPEMVALLAQEIKQHTFDIKEKLKKNQSVAGGI